MKFIHCADLHLDSRMATKLDNIKASERKEELLKTFQRMVAYADANGVKALLIAGDMFDTKKVSKTTRNVVVSEIERHSDIDFYYLKGNHDANSFVNGLEKIPKNLKLFGDDWIEYKVTENISIHGIELSADNTKTIYNTLVLDKDKINIVLLHGQESESDGKKDAEIINLRNLRNKGIDYLALGHIHSYRKKELDKRGQYCYPGCLEGRGFDECGEHGFVLMDIDENMRTIKTEFIPFAYRKIYSPEVDITGCIRSNEIVDKVTEKLNRENYSEESLVRVVLVGKVDVECEKNIEYIKQYFKERFYYFEVKDKTGLSIDIDQYAADISLKGEFVRTVRSAVDLSDDEKNRIIRYGIQFIEGEEVE